MKFKKLIHKEKKKLAVLIDPDKYDEGLIKQLNASNVSFVLVGGSRMKSGNVTDTVRDIKMKCKLPVILFPGDETQLCKEADGIFILSLVSGRNTEYLIEKQVKAAQKIKQLELNTFPVAYILVNSGSISETQKVTKTTPLKDAKVICNTALAAEHLGFKAIYLEAGSGSKVQVNNKIIKTVCDTVTVPVIVGGGIRTAKGVKDVLIAGANVVVVGNSLEKDKKLLNEFSKVFE